jgi:hypothetical protein
LARLRDDDLPRLADFRPLFLAEPRALFLADFRAVFLAPRLAAFLAPFLADFFELLPRALFADFRAEDFFAAFLRGRAGVVRVAAGSLKSSKDEGLEVGAGGVFSIGSGSIQPEPDQPISI